MSAVFARTALRSNSDLFTRVVRFNLHPASTLHTDYFPEGVDSNLIRRVLTSPRGERQLSQWTIGRYQLAPAGFWQFDYVPQRLALLDAEQLRSLMRFAAAAAHHSRIASLIGGTQLRDVKQTLGDEAYNFALKRAALTVGPKPIEAVVSPETPLTAEVISQTGVSWLRTCLGADSPELLKRTSLKLAAASALSTETPPAAIDRDRCWRIVKRILLTEIAPEATACFN
jgi:hypothetical protein